MIREIVSGGCAMVVIGDVSVSHHAAGSFFSKKEFERYRTLTEAIHEEGRLLARSSVGRTATSWA